MFPLLNILVCTYIILFCRCWHQDPTARLSSAELVGKLTRACEVSIYNTDFKLKDTTIIC